MSSPLSSVRLAEWRPPPPPPPHQPAVNGRGVENTVHQLESSSSSSSCCLISSQYRPRFFFRLLWSPSWNIAHTHTPHIHHACTHTPHTHTCMHACTHAHTHARTHAHTHTYACCKMARARYNKIKGKLPYWEPCKCIKEELGLLFSSLCLPSMDEYYHYVDTWWAPL